ncbi:MAG: NAD(P)H-hydrate dehydratase [Proteobacteria bacterium]|jgi:NAD(P)H-hydrate epimerase|nr:NAD(P)H-hydrate dehydratase [Pseudomonadota bacterium]
MAFCWKSPLHPDGNACVHPDDMKVWEASEIRRRPEAGQAMMEVAGREVAMAALRYHPKTVLVFCGTGNNGGDGLVAAHYLRNAECDVHIFAFHDAVVKTPDALAVFGRVQDIHRMVLHEPNDACDILNWKDQRDLLVVDAIFGTGYRPSHSVLMTRVYQAIEELNCPILSVDIASGIDASNGFRGSAEDKSPPRALHATETVTFGSPKIGHFCGEGPEHTGILSCVDIGLGPWPNTGMRRTILCDDYVRNRWPVERRHDVHKGTCGHVVVVGGSEEMPGAAVLASLSALHAGAGLVTLASLSKIDSPAEIMRAHLKVGLDAESTFGALFDKATVMLVGPGLAQNEETLSIVRQVTSYTKTLILDAGALWALGQYETVPTFACSDLFLTPHIGEAARLLGLSNDVLSRDPGRYALELAQKYRANVILKSHVTHIATPKPSLAILPYPNPAMASAGIGDVLAGILAAVASQARGNAFVRWLDVAGIAAVAVSTHSKAGRRVAEHHSVVTANELISHIYVG